jgi:hypothetical protein
MKLFVIQPKETKPVKILVKGVTSSFYRVESFVIQTSVSGTVQSVKDARTIMETRL